MYPYAKTRIYTPPDAPPATYQALLATLGIERAVLIQPSVYGTDNRAMLDAMAALGPRCRGVAVVDSSMSDGEIERLHAASVRVNVVAGREPGPALRLRRREGVKA